MKSFPVITLYAYRTACVCLFALTVQHVANCFCDWPLFKFEKFKCRESPFVCI